MVLSYVKANAGQMTNITVILQVDLPIISILDVSLRYNNTHGDQRAIPVQSENTEMHRVYTFEADPLEGKLEGIVVYAEPSIPPVSGRWQSWPSWQSWQSVPISILRFTFTFTVEYYGMYMSM